MTTTVVKILQWTRVRETYHKRCQQGFDAKDRKIDRVAETNGNTDQNNQQQ